MKKRFIGLKSALVLCLIPFTLTLCATTVYVTPWGGGDGSSWSNSLSSVQQAIDLAFVQDADAVWIAQGTYYPTNYIESNLGSDTLRSRVFELLPGISIYGGFYGDELSLDDRQLDDSDGDGIVEPWELKYPTVLSAERGSISDNSDNCYHVFYGIGLQDSVTFNGLVIQGGYADDYEGENNFGGGMAIFNGGQELILNLRNCQLLNNYAVDGGAACLYSYSSSHLKANIDGCFFKANISNNGGAVAAYVWSSSFSDINTSNSEFIRNESGLYGGAVLGYTITESDTILIEEDGNLFYDNEATYGGATAVYNNGGIGYYSGEKSKYLGNRSLAEGGAIGLYQQGNGFIKAYIATNLFANNSAVTAGGAIYSAVNTGSGVAENNIFQNTIVNNKSENGGGIFINNYSESEQNNAYLINNILWGNDSSQVSHLGAKLFMINNCIQKGDTLAIANNILVDSTLESISNNALWFVDATDFTGNPETEDDALELLTSDWHMHSLPVAVDEGFVLYKDSSLGNNPLYLQYVFSEDTNGVLYKIIDSTVVENSAHLTLINSSDINQNKMLLSAYSGVDIGAYETSLAKAITDTIKNIEEESVIYEGNLEYLKSDKVYTGCVLGLEADFNPFEPYSETTIESTFAGRFSTQISGLEPGRTYYLRTKAINENASYFDTAWVFSTRCEVPVLEEPEAAEDTAFIVRWNTVLGAESYCVDVAFDDTFEDVYPEYCDSLAMDSFLVVELPYLTENETFYVRVAAINNSAIPSLYSATETFEYTNVSVDQIADASLQLTASQNKIYEASGVLIAKAHVFDASGRLVLSAADINRIDLRNLPDGVYFISYQINDNKLSQKVVLR